jgi:chromosome segregation ATPase
MASLGMDLRSLPFQKNVILNAERERILELETKVRLIETENSSLAEQVQYWTRTSKRNQEARLTAEAVKQALEVEKEAFASSSLSQNGTLSRGSPITTLGTSEEFKKTKDKLAATEALLQTTQKKMLNFEGTLEEAYNAVEAMEKENGDLQKQLRTKEAVVEELREQVTLLLEESGGISQSDSSPAFGNVTPHNSDRQLVKKYEELTAEYETVLASNIGLKKTVDLVTKDKARLEESLLQMRNDFENAKLSKDVLARTLKENETFELGNMHSSTNSLSRSTDKGSDLETLQKAYEALEWELVELRAQSIQSGTIHKQLNSSTTEVERLQASLDEATNTANALRQQVYLLDSQLQDMNVGKSERELLESLKDKSREIEELEKRLGEAQDAAQDLQSVEVKAEELEAELIEAREQLSQLKVGK